MSEKATDLLQSTFSEDGVPGLSESSELLALAQGGDERAVNDLLARYQERVRRIVHIQLGTHLRTAMDSMDIVQETLHDAARSLKRDPALRHENLLRWLGRIALNRIRDAHDYHAAERRDRRREIPLVGRDDTAGASAMDPPSPHSGVEQQAFKNEVRELLDQTVAELNDDYRRVIVLRDYCGQDWETITREMSRPNTHASRQLHQRAWIRVRQVVWPRLGKPS